jgi:hypothetical protein
MDYEFEEVEAVTYHDKLEAVHAAIRQPVKDSLNPHFNSTFASLNECNRVVADAVREVGGCDYWQRAVYNPESKCYEMETVFAAGGTEQVLSRHPFRDDPNPQKSASASTYARRYSLLSAFNLAAEDDDGNQAARPSDSARGVEAAKQRMWAAVKGYSQRMGIDPKQVIADMQSSPEWREDADYFEMTAMRYENA